MITSVDATGHKSNFTMNLNHVSSKYYVIIGEHLELDRSRDPMWMSEHLNIHYARAYGSGATCSPRREHVPTNRRAYDRVWTVILHAAHSLDWMTPPQWDALERYVRDGGNLIIEGTSQLGRATVVRKFLDRLSPLALDRLTEIPRPARLREQGSYSAGVVQPTAPPFIGGPLVKPRDSALESVYGWSGYRGTHHWLARRVLGKGRVTYVGACVANDAFGYTRDQAGRPAETIVDVAAALLHYDWRPEWRPLRMAK